MLVESRCYLESYMNISIYSLTNPLEDLITLEILLYFYFLTYGFLTIAPGMLTPSGLQVIV